VNDEREVFLDVLEQLVIHGDELAPLPFCQGDVKTVCKPLRTVEEISVARNKNGS
jgi:hypothetical protein